MNGHSDIAVVISYRPDSLDRRRNLERLVGYYARFAPGAELCVVEQGEVPSLDIPGITTTFLADQGPHWKTRNMNLAAARSTRDVFLMSDCDTIPRPEALEAGFQLLAEGAEFVHLYDGIVIDLSADFAERHASWDSLLAALRHFPPDSIAPDAAPEFEGQTPLYGNAKYRAVGGCFLCRREAFFEIGGWNENFIGYGYEDQEIDQRAARLGRPFARVEGHNLYHFAHARLSESGYGSFSGENSAELARIEAMSAEELAAYVVRGFRTLRIARDQSYRRIATEDADGWQQVNDTRIDLSELTIGILADARDLRYMKSCLKPFLEYLEAGFRNYDVRLCELGGTHYRSIHAKIHIRHHRLGGANEMEGILSEAGRPLAHMMILDNDLPRAIAPFERLIAGAPVFAVFGAAVDA